MSGYSAHVFSPVPGLSAYPREQSCFRSKTGYNLYKAITKEIQVMIPDPSQSLPKIQASTVIHNIGQLVTVAQSPIRGATGLLQILEHAALAVHNGTIVWIGPDDDTQPKFLQDASEN